MRLHIGARSRPTRAVDAPPGAWCLLCDRVERESFERPVDASAWKHAHNPMHRRRGRRHGQRFPRARAFRRKAGVRISAAPSTFVARAIAHEQARVSRAADECFARRGVAQLHDAYGDDSDRADRRRLAGACHGCDGRADFVAVTVPDRRVVGSYNPRLLTDDRGLAASRLPDG